MTPHSFPGRAPSMAYSMQCKLHYFYISLHSHLHSHFFSFTHRRTHRERGENVSSKKGSCRLICLAPCHVFLLICLVAVPPLLSCVCSLMFSCLFSCFAWLRAASFFLVCVLLCFPAYSAALLGSVPSKAATVSPLLPRPFSGPLSEMTKHTPYPLGHRV